MASHERCGSATHLGLMRRSRLSCPSTHGCFTLKEVLFTPEVAFAPDKKHVDLKLCLVGSPGGATDLVGCEAGTVHETDDFGKEGRAVVEWEQRRLDDDDLGPAKDFSCAFQNLELVSLDIQFHERVLSQVLACQQIVEPVHRHIYSLR